MLAYIRFANEDESAPVRDKGDGMFSANNLVVAVFSFLGVIVVGGASQTVGAAGQSATSGSQTSGPAIQTLTAVSPKVAAGEIEAKKLLLLMDADKSGKVSRAEFMSFMAAEFDRLDTNHDGELDVRELEKSQLETAHRGGTHR